MPNLIAVTPGEPAGIGPELCIQYALSHSQPKNQIVLIADPELISQRAAQLGLNVKLLEYTSPQSAEKNFENLGPGSNQNKEILILPVKLAQSSQPGTLNSANSAYVLKTLDVAVQACLRGEFDALVTGPVQKSVINAAGFPFIGHTEYLAEKCQCETVVMMLATEGLRVALATTHLALADVPAAITKTLLRKIITILHQDLEEKFKIISPQILVCGLNPHAGESGHLGKEEINIIQPVIEEFLSAGMNLVGPLAADTLFTEKNLQKADAVLAMYHDQGLPVLKYKGFGHATNITLGLPIIRTSVDHGTALDLAGTGKADIGSLLTAIDYASAMISPS